jgi:hypothetical protein
MHTLSTLLMVTERVEGQVSADAPKTVLAETLVVGGHRAFASLPEKS